MDTIAPGIHWISGGYVNSYVVDGDEGVTLIDTLVPKKEDVVVAALGKIGRSISDVTAIVLTHSHADHAGSAAALKTQSGARLYASEADAPAIRGDTKPPNPPMMDRVPFLKPVLGLMPSPPAVEVDELVAEGMTGLPADLRAIDTPGHTPGHTSFLLDRQRGILFVGDAAAHKKGTVSRGWFNRKRDDIDASIRHLAEVEFTMACFGHSKPLRDGAAAAFRRFVESA